MQIDLFLAVLAALVVSNVSVVAVKQAVFWFATRRLDKEHAKRVGQVGTGYISGLGFRPPAPLTPDEMETLAQKFRDLKLEEMSEGMLADVMRRCMQEQTMRRSALGGPNDLVPGHAPRDP